MLPIRAASPSLQILPDRHLNPDHTRLGIHPTIFHTHPWTGYKLRLDQNLRAPQPPPTRAHVAALSLQRALQERT